MEEIDTCFCKYTQWKIYFVVVVVVVFTTSSLFLAGNSGRVTWVRHSSRTSSATHSYECEQYVRLHKQCYGCMCLAFLTCAETLRDATAHGGCTDTVRVCTESRLWEKKFLPRQGLEPASVLRLAFQSDAVSTELSPPLVCMFMGNDL